MAKYIMSIDQGTTGTTVSLIDAHGLCVGRADEDFEQIFPQPGWVEHNPDYIWKTVENSTRKVLEKTSIAATDIAAIGITNQRETVLVWERKSGRPIYNAIVWQCRRTAPFCESLRKKKLDRMIRKKTGLVTDPYFSASKIKWILQNVAGAKKRQSELACGTIDTFLLWQLTGGRSHLTDVSNASRTMLMNLSTGNWDAELMKLFGIQSSMLAEIRPSSGEFGVTRGLSFLPDGIPISGIAGDQQAALFGQTCFSVGEAKCTFGTGSFLLMNTGREFVRSKSGLLSTVAWQLKGDKHLTYALEGGAFVCGAAVQWLRDGLDFIKHSHEIERLAREVSDTGGVEFVPALTGLGAPHWNANARGLICGLTRGTHKGHIARATLEAMALQNTDILIAMQKDLGKKMKRLRVDGGAAANNLLMQIQADYLGVAIDRPKMIETTSAGAAYLAGLGVGLWSDLSQIKKVWEIDKSFFAEIKPVERDLRRSHWNSAVRRAMLAN